MRPFPFVAAAFAAAAVRGVAAPELASLFRDHAVLQEDRAVPVWGRAGAGEHVSVSFAGQVVGATAGSDGRWIAVLAPLASSSAGAELAVTGKGRIAVHDVVVGEVWLCSGGPAADSIGGDGGSASPGDHAAADAGARQPLVRCFTVARRASAVPEETAKGSWEAVPAAAASPFTPASLFFARDLFARLGVPVGIVESAWPDTPVESWMSPAALAAFPGLAGGSPGPRAAADGDPRVPASLFNGMIHPLLPYAIRGAIWFQGGRDVERPAEFAVRFPAMIAAWRSHFGEGDFPFYWVQLAGQRTPPAGRWAAFREAQSRALSLPSTGEAVAIDMGADGGLKAGDRREVGRRLALIAKAGAYSISEDYCGPVFGAIEADGSSIRVRFSRGGDGLTASGKPLQSFEVAGADRVFHAASAFIEGDLVVAHSAAVRQPVAVRYAWTDAPDANLYNGAGLPAAPFRSDDW